MKKLILTVLAITSMSAAFAQSTYICLDNTTSTTKYIAVTGIDNNDWGNGNRPDHNFEAQEILPGQTLCNEEDLSDNVMTTQFTFHVTGPGITTTMTYVGQGWVAQDGTNLIGKGRSYSAGMTLGASCNYGSNCTQFDIIDKD